jgi:hypothetical protein
MKTMNKFIKYSLCLVFIAFPLASVLGYYMASNSEPFYAAKSAIISSEEVRSKVGEIKKLDLDFLGYSVRYSGPKGDASFRVATIGTISSAKVFIDLERGHDQWVVKQLLIK